MRAVKPAVLARVTAAATFVLLLAGASVTSTGSGLAVPDWPLSYGMLMPPMKGGILFEHGHRMIAGLVAVLILALAIVLARSDASRTAKRLGIAAAALVIVQAGLGGLTVLLRLPPAVSIAHAALAMTVFSLVVAIAIITSDGWRGAERAGASPRVRSLARVALGVVFAQILAGALVRHTGAGLACPDFPLCHGRLWPALTHPWIVIHFVHRLGALAVLLAVGALALGARREGPRVRAGAAVAFGLVLLQVALGGAAVLSGLKPALTVAHHAGGALLLVTTLWVVLWSRPGARAIVAASTRPLASGLGVPA